MDTSYTQFPRRPISSSSASFSSTSFGKSAKRPAATVPESSAGKRVNRSQCRLCPVAHSNLPLHSEQSHFPWFFNQDSVCWRCQKVSTTDAEMAAHSMPNHRPSFLGNHTLLWGQLFLGSLHFLASLLSLSSLWHLFTYVHEEHLFPSTPRSIPERLSSSLNYFEEQFLQRPVGALREYCTSPPSRLLSLTHWETIIIILSRLSPEDRERFRTYACPMDLDGRPIEIPSSPQPQAPVAALQAPTPIPFIDTLMHLDMPLSRHHLSSLDELEQQFRTGNLELVAVVANYVFSRFWGLLPSHLQNDARGRIFFTIRLHPHEAPGGFSLLHSIQTFLPHPKCVGLGEIGLDYSRGCSCAKALGMSCSCRVTHHEMQKAFLHAILSPLQAMPTPFSKVIVLHYRGQSPDDDSAFRDTLSILQELGLTQLSIHRHCFLGSRDELELWSQVFPNCSYGLTSKFLERPFHRAVIPRIPHDKLLLESDAPLLSPQAAQSSFKTSWLCHHSISIIAQLQGTTPQLLVQQCNQNARTLYGI